ncbi:MAG: hypothetical protein ONB48_04370 [candidate division KSB1 bacterium]|nr:hypothetical protein [candidate division KSB1 bacterium]MDZ7274454.1 hypothetical protein [candidate division KSB1 bacterium]MDZ7284884.1 hypothetical protein [candidate division KSB1 bacterium]MDZ7297695.1 hypothetical protein [candidate division KSB1 bacterium]MDZ7305881.1 hypothetical protein [candidate division KSB1 bacterium]
MVDINLLGDDDASEDRQNEENYAKTVNLDEPSKANDVGTTPFGRETAGASFQRDTIGASFARKSLETQSEGSSRTKAYLIVLGLILAALTAVFFMIPRSERKTTTQLPPMQTQPEEPPATQANTGVDSMAGTTPPEPTGVEAFEMLAPREREVVASTRTGMWAVLSLLRSFSAPNNFTLITYHGDRNNRFLVEFLSTSADATGSLTSTIQANVSPSDLKTVSESEQPSSSGTLRKVLVAGTMDDRAGLAGFRGTLNRMSNEQLSTWLRELAQRQGLSIKSLRTGQAEAAGAGTPMQIHLAGPNAGIQGFLQEFTDANPNITIAKIILCPVDHRTFSDENLDLVLNFNLVEML